MSRNKYIITNNSHLVYVFPELINHADMANSLRLSKEDIHSAGFIQFSYDKELNRPDCHCYGDSVSLKKKTVQQTEDKDWDAMSSNEIAMRQFFPHYFE